jgi:hypothetical protein
MEPGVQDQPPERDTDPSESGDQQAGFERREHPRTPVQAPAVIFFDPGSHSIDCTIRNISAGGARVVLLRPETLPDMVRILVRPGAYHSALVRWRIGLEVGLEFVD